MECESVVNFSAISQPSTPGFLFQCRNQHRPIKYRRYIIILPLASLNLSYVQLWILSVIKSSRVKSLRNSLLWLARWRFLSGFR